MKKLGNIFLLIGAGLFIFVIYTKVQTSMEQKKLMEEFTSLDFIDAAFNEDTEDGEELEQTPVNKGDTIGMLEIPDIDLKTPIVEGADQENICYAVGHLPSSASLNELGKKDYNFAIAGHRSYTHGQYFNRLDELEIGDEMTVYARNKVLTYQIFDKQIAKPTDVHVVNPIEDKAVVTLITCHPKFSNKQRLIVFSELVTEKTLDGNEFAKLIN